MRQPHGSTDARFRLGRDALGPPGSWPASLKSSVRLLLDCRLPMYLAWGPDFIQFYNDAYAPILGVKDGEALGGDARLTWPEIWPTIGPMWVRVLEGEGIGADRFKLTIERYGYPEDCYFSFSYSPVPDDQGNPAGVLVTFAETTNEVVTERRQAFQLSLADALRTLDDPVAIAERAAAMLGAHLAVGRAGYGEIDKSGKTVSVERDWSDGTMDSLAGESRELDSFGPNIIAELRAGRTLQLADIGADPRSAPYAAGYASIGTYSLMVVPLLKEGELKAVLYMHCSQARQWSETDRIIAEEVAQRTWDAVERAHAERELSAERRRLQAILDTIPTGLIMLDEHGTLLIENAEWKRTWAGSAQADGIVDKDRYKGFRPDSGEPVSALEWPWAISLQQGVKTRDVVLDIERFDGSRGTIVVSSAPVVDDGGRVIAAVAANMDISELRAAQAQLLEEDRRKTEFLATLAHELRNPLAPIRSGLNVLRLNDGDAAGIARVRDIMERQVGQMVHLIDDLLDIARISGDRLELRKLRADLGPIISSAIETSLPAIEARQHVLHVDLPDQPLEAEIDPTRMTQVVANLLNNAAKYTPYGGRIELAMGREGDRAVIRVRDTGIGIPADAQGRIFDMFSQVAPGLDRPQGGLGIGLALVRRLVDMHGGEVDVRSAGPGMGSTFTVSLPLDSVSLLPAQDAAPGEARDFQAPAAQCQVLVVDDNVDAASTLSMLLELHGHAVQMAHDGADALELLGRFTPRIAFLDIGMPRMNGYDTARAIRRMKGLEHVCLVALTGWGADADRQRSEAAGFDFHLTKPVQLAEIERILERIAH